MDCVRDPAKLRGSSERTFTACSVTWPLFLMRAAVCSAEVDMVRGREKISKCGGQISSDVVKLPRRGVTITDLCSKNRTAKIDERRSRRVEEDHSGRVAIFPGGGSAGYLVPKQL